MSTTHETIPRPDGDEHREVMRQQATSSARYLVAGLLAAAFGGCVTTVQIHPADDLGRIAMFLLVSSIPVLAMHLIVTAPGRENRHHISNLMKIMPVLGVFSAIPGLAMMIERACAGAGYLFGGLAFLVAWVCMQSADRAKRDNHH